jgi:hypothetical protein
MEKLVITINPKGEVKIDAQGFTDGSCLAATKPFEEALGDVTSETRKPEANVQAEQKEVRRAYNG